MKQRLQKILSRAGIVSRRAAEGLILEGRVEVDGVVVKKLGTLVDELEQDIRVDGARVRPARRRRYVMLHKPRGYVTTRSDPSRRPTVMTLLPARYQTLFPVGRLDMATSGLLLLTDDGELAQKIAHPRYGVPKTYAVAVAGQPTERVLERAVRGITVSGERLRLDDVRMVGVTRRRAKDGSVSRLRVTLRQGRNREIRRLFRALGYPVVELHRDRIGPLSARGLAAGAFRALTAAEVEALRRLTRTERSRGTSRPGSGTRSQSQSRARPRPRPRPRPRSRPRSRTAKRPKRE